MSTEFYDPETNDTYVRQGLPELWLKYHPSIVIKSLEVRCPLGKTISDFYKEVCIPLAKEWNCKVWFEGNGIKFIAEADSPEDLVSKYLDDCYTYDVHELGPKELILDEEYKKQKDTENTIKEAERKAKWEAEKKLEDEDKEYISSIIKDEEYMCTNIEEFQKGLDKNKDPYGRVCYLYLLDLAKLLQIISRTRDITNNDVRVCEHLIRHYGITGFQHGCVKGILRLSWKLYKESLFDYNYDVSLEDCIKEVKEILNT